MLSLSILPPGVGTAPSPGDEIYTSGDVIAERAVVVHAHLDVKDFMPVREARENARREFRQHRAAEDVVDVARTRGDLLAALDDGVDHRVVHLERHVVGFLEPLGDAAQLEPGDLLQDLRRQRIFFITNRT